MDCDYPRHAGAFARSQCQSTTRVIPLRPAAAGSATAKTGSSRFGSGFPRSARRPADCSRNFMCTTTATIWRAIRSCMPRFQQVCGNSRPRRPKPRIGGRKEITTASVMSLCPHEGDSDKVLFGLEALTIMGSLGATVAFNLKEGHEVRSSRCLQGFLDAGPKGDARRSGESRGGC